MINVIQLPAQDVFTTPREIAGRSILLTSIDGQLYPSGQQAMDLLEITLPFNFRHHLDAVTAEECSRGAMVLPPCYLTVFELPVYTPPASATSGGGGTQLVRFYHPWLILEIASRTRNSPHKTMLMRWLLHVGNEVIQRGYYVDQTAYQHDPAVVANLQQEIARLNAGLVEKDRQLAIKQTQLTEAIIRYGNARDYGIYEEE